ncbi:VWA domain-containing protein [Chitinispirillales bacterium ANBcel5]|uniref:vWA domain-containing protein n=1 Tax=Cellulosispirillum alkaliphilum TaxID=3039283 RepID=UPI002A515D07|nr:VWA domain-containing protein [Chitinispirillales bacterium ANBcel5]
MIFENPELFSFLILIPLSVLFFLYVQKRKREAMNRFVSLELAPKLTPSSARGRFLLKKTLFLLFILFTVLTLVRPRFGAKEEQIERKGVDIMVALDVSKSMLAQDLRPNRLERAKHEIRNLISMLRGDRVGLIIFAGESFVQCPLTLDYAAFLSFLQPVSTDWVQIQGTAIAEAINQARRAMKSNDNKHKVLILISDGEDHEGGVIEAAESAAKEGIIIHTVGIGSQRGVPIPVSNRGTSVEYKTDRDGNIVMTRLNPETLEKIALKTSGEYFHAGSNFDFSAIYEKISEMEKNEYAVSRATHLKERYQVFLFLALLFIITEFFISERVKIKRAWKGRFE